MRPFRSVGTSRQRLVALKGFQNLARGPPWQFKVNSSWNGIRQIRNLLWVKRQWCIVIFAFATANQFN